MPPAVTPLAHNKIMLKKKLNKSSKFFFFDFSIFLIKSRLRIKFLDRRSNCSRDSGYDGQTQFRFL